MINKVHNDLISTFECNCLTPNCCCSELMLSSQVQKTILGKRKAFEINEHVPTEHSDKIYSRYDVEMGETRLFCYLCSRYSNKIYKKNNLEGHWVFEGVSLTQKSAIKRHLHSSFHRNSQEKRSFDSEVKPFQNNPDNNSMLVQFLVESELGFDHIPKFESLLSSILHKPIDLEFNRFDFASFVGINFENEKQSIKEELSSVFHKTKQELRFTICFDKSVTAFDATRQVVMVSYIDVNTGELKDKLITAARLFDDTEAGSLEHVRTQCQEMFNLKYIVAECSDITQDSIYQNMLKDSGFHPKIIHLNDLGKRINMFFEYNEPKWMTNVFDSCEKICDLFSNGSKDAETYFFEFCNFNPDFVFTSIDGMIRTKYIEKNMSVIDWILINLNVFHKLLPILMVSKERSVAQFHDQFSEVYEIVKSPVFVSRILFIKYVLEEASLHEKKTRSLSFGPFDFKGIVKDLHNFLSHLNCNSVIDLPKDCASFLSSGNLMHTFTLYNKKYNVQLHYNWDDENPGIKNQLKNEFIEWINILLNSFNDYLQIPTEIQLICSFFHDEIDNLNFYDKLEHMIKIFATFNIKFYRCNAGCKGVRNCNCTMKEINLFFTDLLRNRNKFRNHETLNVDYDLMFSYYLNNQQVMRLRTINIIRIIEVARLLKASKSSIEPVSSDIERVVDGHFKNRYKNPESNPDLVERIVFMKHNSRLNDIKQLKK